MKREYNGAISGVGAVYHWTGNNPAGGGAMASSARTAPAEDDTQFIKPFQTTCAANFQFTPVTNGTNVRWSMDGPNLHGQGDEPLHEHGQDASGRTSRMGWRG
ncbi:MAG: hypothetical protein IPL52_07740 [Flavobacteriales bacterium]|nr:hypothetical protein [Flavobacteriales bacterium]